MEVSVPTAIIFAQFGPYHHARVAALQAAAFSPVIPAQIASGTSTYEWTEIGNQCTGLQTLYKGLKEEVSPVRVFFAAIRFFRQFKIRMVFLPSYAPAPEFALFAAAKLLGLSTIMMNESHARTERAQGWKRRIKHGIIRRFDAALVGGQPQRCHFTGLGIPEDRIFTGYDAIDNDWFQNGAANAREKETELRKSMSLPNRYFLSLGRMVEKKNLSMLIKAYAAFCKQCEEPVALAMVGSGDEEPMLRELAKSLKLRVHDAAQITPEIRSSLTYRDVIFYGFRQINENPRFYALADAFVLPSLWEEWGLVVNEAMACSLPVLVAKGIGCAEDLVEEGENGYTFDPQNAEEFCQLLVRLASDSALRKKMGTHSLKIINRWGCDNFARNAIAAANVACRKGR